MALIGDAKFEVSNFIHSKSPNYLISDVSFLL